MRAYRPKNTVQAAISNPEARRFPFAAAPDCPGKYKKKRPQTGCPQTLFRNGCGPSWA